MSEAHYRKIAHKVVAWQFDNQRVTEFPAWVSEKAESLKHIGTAEGRVIEFQLPAPEQGGTRVVKSLDWVIKDQAGNVYVTSPEVFTAIYELDS